MTLFEAVKVCYGKYVTFSGRATRSEFWKFIVFMFLVLVALVIINSVLVFREEFFEPIIVASLLFNAVLLGFKLKDLKRFWDFRARRKQLARADDENAGLRGEVARLRRENAELRGEVAAV